MATDVTNGAGTGTGSSKNGGITVRANKKNFQYQDSAEGNEEYLIAKFDLKYTDTADPQDAADLADRFDDPRYYQGDAIT
jgi:hypothetical protein